jgi:2-C-methyl-D-erythritol 4-phosphate cytidylyltransferase
MMSQNKKVFAIIPSAGSGTRFGSNVPKQYFKINNETIIEKTLKHFVKLKEIEKIVIPISPED